MGIMNARKCQNRTKTDTGGLAFVKGNSHSSKRNSAMGGGNCDLEHKYVLKL